MCNNAGFSAGLNSQLECKETRHHENERPKRSIATKRRRDTSQIGSTAGLDAPILTGPATLVGYNSSLCVENQHPPAERPKCATTRVSVEDKNSQID